MEYKNKEIYIVCHKEAQSTGEKLKTALSDAGMSAKLSCGNTLGEINAAVINCDAAVFVVSESFWQDASLKSITNKLTGKPSLSYLSGDVELTGGLKYFLEKTEKTDSDILPDDFVGKMKKLLDDAVLYKDVIIIVEEEDATKADGIVKKLGESGLSSRIESYSCDCQDALSACGAAIILDNGTESDRIREIEAEANKLHKPYLVRTSKHLDDEKKKDKTAAKAIQTINKIKPPAHTIVSDNIGAIKLLKRPWMKAVLSSVFIQLCIFIVWLASMQSIFYGLIFPAVLGVFVFLLMKERKKCSYSKCKKNHNGKKVKVVVGKRETSCEFKFCGTHESRKDVSAQSKINLYLTIVLVAVTLAFSAFLIVGKVKAEDFTFLDIRRQIELGKPAEFTDAGFEAFIREYLHVGDASISRKSLLDVKALNFDAHNVKQPINTLEDLKYFPNLKIFECEEGAEIYGDFSSFAYTTELKTFDIGFTEIGGDIASLSVLDELEELIKNEDSQAPKDIIYGDVLALKDMNLNVIKLHNTNVNGDISFAKNMHNLFRIRLPYTNVSGDISSLPDGALGVVDLAKTNVTGDIAVFEGKNMISVDLSETDVYGDISVFEGMRDLSMIRFPNCGKITGDLNSVSGLSNLNFLELDFTDVKGDIGILSELYDLQVLKASAANISGDISVLADKHRLIQVYMDGSRDIYGDIAALAGLENLEQLGLQDTGVSGNAYELYNNERIWDLNLSGTDTYSQEESMQSNEPTLKSLGFDENGKLNDAAFGVTIKIDSAAFEGVEESTFFCKLRIREKFFEVKITFPDKAHEITFDGKTYVYKPIEFEVAEADFDVEAALADYVGGDISGINDEIVCGIDDYCNRRFGFNADALMEMKYE